MKLKQGLVSYLTLNQKKTFLNLISFYAIKTYVIRLEYNSCFYSDIFKCTYRMVKLNEANFNKLLSIRINNSTIHDIFFGKLMKVLIFCRNLLDIWFDYEKNWTETSLAKVHLFMKTKANEKNTLNVTIMHLYDSSLSLVKNKRRVGYLLENISLHCKDYFFTHTNPITNVFYMKHFLRAADLVSRKNENNKPVIYLGDYILKQHDKTYSEYSGVLEAGKISLQTQIPNRYKHISGKSYWPL